MDGHRDIAACDPANACLGESAEIDGTVTASAANRRQAKMISLRFHQRDYTVWPIAISIRTKLEHNMSKSDMSVHDINASIPPILQMAARSAASFRSSGRQLLPTASTEDLRARFNIPLADEPRSGEDVIRDLVAAAEPGLVGSTDPGFMAWVIGGSHVAGVAADWLTSAWGQNAAIYQCSPAAAIAEEAAADWLVDVLGLPQGSSVGFTTGATMAGFTCLAAARGEVLLRHGVDIEQTGLASAPPLTIFIGADAHASNHAALRYLGFGRDQFREVAANAEGVMHVDALAQAMKETRGPAIVISQAGHINTGAFDDFPAIAALCRQNGAWLHVDGAFGLWAQAGKTTRDLSRGVEEADSWAVDGHKWLQIPYDSGFAIVRDPIAHRRAMDVTAGYLNAAPSDVRNPTEYNPELSRRARGFAVWAVMQTLGRQGIAKMVDAHCEAARRLSARIDAIPGLRILNRVVLNQLALGFNDPHGNKTPAELAQAMSASLNATGRYLVMPATWRGEAILRVSIIGGGDCVQRAEDLGRDIEVHLRRLVSAPTG